MVIRRTKHAVFDIEYYLAWIPKYSKHTLVGRIAQCTKEVLQRIAEEYRVWVHTMEVMEDHVHVFGEAPASYSPAEVVQIVKSISAREAFRKFPRLRKQFWSGALWSDGYFVGNVGDRVTSEVVRRYTEYQTREHISHQLPMFE
jgi:putative transposase